MGDEVNEFEAEDVKKEDKEDYDGEFEEKDEEDEDEEIVEEEEHGAVVVSLVYH